MALTPNVTAEVNPSEASLQAFAQVPDTDALAMLNLLEFSPDVGREAYARYTAVASKTVAKRGGAALLSGAVVPAEHGWDSIVIVRYPRRAAYLDMQSDPAYVGAIPDRTAGLSRRLLYPFALPDDAKARVESAAPGAVAVQLIGWIDGLPAAPVEAAGDAGELLYSLPASGPGMVSDGQWDLMRVWLYGSVSDANDAGPQRRVAGAASELTVLVDPD